MYGKNVMGPYADRLSYRERWEVIHYIRSLQAKSKTLEYTHERNTLNAEATPWTVMEPSMGIHSAGVDTTMQGGRSGSAHYEMN